MAYLPISPGPWKLFRSGPGPFHQFDIRDADSVSIGEFFSGVDSEDHARQEANAGLATAAPVLLNSAQLALQYLQSRRIPVPPEHADWHDLVVKSLVGAVAIAHRQA